MGVNWREDFEKGIRKLNLDMRSWNCLMKAIYRQESNPNRHIFFNQERLSLLSFDEWCKACLEDDSYLYCLPGIGEKTTREILNKIKRYINEPQNLR